MGIALPGRFREIWLGDSEFCAPPGERPRPGCAVFREFKSGRTLRYWQDELAVMNEAPFSTGKDVLFVAYYASAEMGCFLALEWPLPEKVLDLFVEFRALNNCVAVPSGFSLLGALVAHGLDSMAADEKTSMRNLIMGGGPWNDQEQRDILEYCEHDVRALETLLPAMLPQILGTDPHPGKALSQALHRGRFMKAAAHMEFTGVPIDLHTLRRFQTSWDPIKRRLIDAINTEYDVYEDGTFTQAKFEDYLVRRGIPWPRLESGRLALDDDTFRQRAKAFPCISALRELRRTLSGMHVHKLAVGADGRNRCPLSAFRSITGRNQPSNSQFIYGMPAWIRGLIKPPPDAGVIYLDFRAQEIGIAAALSGDELMMEGYRTGDPYLSFAIQAGLASKDATKQSHKAVRDRCKQLVLGLQYGMTAKGLASRLGVPLVEAEHLMDKHRRTYRKFWQWSDRVVDAGMMGQTLRTVFGWPIHPNGAPKPRSLRNFPMQANGAEMLRLACSKGTESGISICAPVHDAILIEAPLDCLEQRIGEMRECMAEASKAVLSGFEIQTSFETIRYPDRYMDEDRGRAMWARVMGLLDPEDLAA